MHKTTREILVGAAATVLGAIAWQIISTATSWFPAPLDLASSLLKSAVRFSTTRHALPGWLLLLVIAPLSIVGLCSIVLVLAAIAFPSKVPDYRDYTADSFYGIRWRWKYPLDPHHITPYCPTCDTLLVTSVSWGIPEVLVFRCETCAREVARLEGPAEEVPRRVLRQVDRILRTDEWKSRIA